MSKLAKTLKHELAELVPPTRGRHHRDGARSGPAGVSAERAGCAQRVDFTGSEAPGSERCFVGLS
jgi:hypothetical protein